MKKQTILNLLVRVFTAIILLASLGMYAYYFFFSKKLELLFPTEKTGRVTVYGVNVEGRVVFILVGAILILFFGVLFFLRKYLGSFIVGLVTTIYTALISHGFFYIVVWQEEKSWSYIEIILLSSLCLIGFVFFIAGLKTKKDK